MYRRGKNERFGAHISVIRHRVKDPFFSSSSSFSFFESSFSLSKMEAVEAQRRRYKGYQILGAKIVSEKKKGSAGKTFC